MGATVSRYRYENEARSGCRTVDGFRDVEARWCPEMVPIAAGCFMMGSPYGGGYQCERPQHEVHIDHAFALGRYPVTFREYDHFCDETGRLKPRDDGWGRDRRPAIYVTWDEAEAYCRWLCCVTAKAYRLPTEAEWEYACRASSKTLYASGDRLTKDQANYGQNGQLGKTTPVGMFAPNAWGLFDMHGGVWEWCEDCWHENYQGAPDDGSAWRETGPCAHVLRGGSWLNAPDALRAANRYWSNSDFLYNYVGFRVARTLS